MTLKEQLEVYINNQITHLVVVVGVVIESDGGGLSDLDVAAVAAVVEASAPVVPPPPLLSMVLSMLLLLLVSDKLSSLPALLVDPNELNHDLISAGWSVTVLYYDRFFFCLCLFASQKQQQRDARNIWPINSLEVK